MMPLVIAQPDEWLLCIRNGRLVRAGIGIRLWRLPGDVSVRFTSTMQRVGFSVDALSAERVRVSIEGFILWSVSAGGEGPLRAYQKLGLASGDGRHLLSTPQHRAFQQLLASQVQRLAATAPLDQLLRQDGLLTLLRRQLATLEQDMGIRVDQVELLRARPADEELLRHMSADFRAQQLEREQAMEEQQFAARLEQARRETDVEERKSQAVRDHELARMVAEKVSDAFKNLPLHEARWITVGPHSPVGSLAALIAAARECADSTRKL
jgi:flotillin